MGIPCNLENTARSLLTSATALWGKTMELPIRPINGKITSIIDAVMIDQLVQIRAPMFTNFAIIKD
ncbi:hypothetical protein BBBOND_0208560 [Babesia bigemina]|uniref:Uncharacterized protein n=1 Tax=Babesia bigemina TaxID=5866 RepID=A0A061D6R3_BABBI|nr:hypothetical protein BBBOND_0208560 [Babesia bigemina]CDR95702.1 hypothetical protein BBBOND_0208560 [Babesia bigemina]|eukprot:XP_012767888.1 hypothetical protein BBBOND_0208560 [Babesia bigemina]